MQNLSGSSIALLDREKQSLRYLSFRASNTANWFASGVSEAKNRNFDRTAEYFSIVLRCEAELQGLLESYGYWLTLGAPVKVKYFDLDNQYASACHAIAGLTGMLGHLSAAIGNMDSYDWTNPVDVEVTRSAWHKYLSLPVGAADVASWSVDTLRRLADQAASEADSGLRNLVAYAVSGSSRIDIAPPSQSTWRVDGPAVQVRQPMPADTARAKAEAVVKQDGFPTSNGKPSMRKLAQKVGCHAKTLKKAIDDSHLLRASLSQAKAPRQETLEQLELEQQRDDQSRYVI